MNVEILSKRCIKPSFPTPNHLRLYRLSLLDQFIPPIYVPLILYYPSTYQNRTSLSDPDFVSRRSILLKQSLSETLSKFYTFAGKIKDNLSIDCNDDGAYYVEARSESPLAEFLTKPDLRLTTKFLPSESSWTGPAPGSHVAMIQETTFACSSIVIGVLISHAAADGTAASSFLKCWSAIARESFDETLSPRYDAPLIFPQVAEFPVEMSLFGLYSPYLRKARVAARRAVFDATAIDNLKAKASSSDVKNPTRVQVVTAFLCKCIITALRTKSNEPNETLITHTVNMRPRFVPPFSSTSMGNFLWPAPILCANYEDIDLPNLVSKIRDSIAKTESDFVHKLKGKAGFLRLSEEEKETRTIFGNQDLSNCTNYICFTSWCKFGFYDIDFGWGRPFWVTCVSAGEAETFFFNSVLLMDTHLDKRIEVWLFLEEADMSLLENHNELMAYASMDPSPLKMS